MYQSYVGRKTRWAYRQQKLKRKNIYYNCLRTTIGLYESISFCEINPDYANFVSKVATFEFKLRFIGLFCNLISPKNCQKLVSDYKKISPSNSLSPELHFDRKSLYNFTKLCNLTPIRPQKFPKFSVRLLWKWGHRIPCLQSFIFIVQLYILRNFVTWDLFVPIIF